MKTETKVLLFKMSLEKIFGKYSMIGIKIIILDIDA